MPKLSTFIGEFLLPFAPIIAAGMIAGYVGTPHGFMLGSIAGLAGSLVSILWRYYSIGFVDLAAMHVSIGSWALGTAVATGISGLAGERMHAKRVAA